MEPITSYDETFEASKDNALDYPTNLVRTETYQHTLEQYREKLNAKGIFHPVYRSLGFVELYEKKHAFHKSKAPNTADQLSKYIDEEDGAPLWRMIFLHSISARGALGCSKDQLMLLLTYFQVMPCFLDFVLTFCTRERPIAHAAFRSEDYLEKDSPEFPMPRLKRSGIQMQHAFNLLSVERASSPAEKNQWPLRQVALYYSFDITNGRSLWFVLKGNPIMMKRILSATERQRRLKPAGITSPEASFIAALEVHMIMIDWCSESWAEYIEYLEDAISTNSVEGKTAPVDDVTRPIEIEMAHSPRNTNTFDSHNQPTSIFSGSRRWTFQKTSSSLFNTIRRVTGLEPKQRLGEEDAAEKGIVNAAELQEQESEEDQDGLSDLDKEFSFRKYQNMSQLSMELERALVALEQNKGVLEAIEEHYHSVVRSYGFATYMKEDLCGNDLAAFFAKIRSTERELDIHYRRLQTLSQALENDKVMFTTLLQYKSEKVSEYFASSAKISSNRMEDIAVRTEQETLSMHVITIFTLIFLPGTFIATLFSSGVFHWDDDGTLGSDWVIRQNALKLFFSVSIPMMAIILICWSLLFVYMRRKRQQRRQGSVLHRQRKRERNDKKGRGSRKNTSKIPNHNCLCPDQTPLVDFCRYIDRKKKRYVGLDASDNDTSFVPLDVLRDYWTKARVGAVLKAYRETLTSDIETIRKHYIRTFSYNLNDTKLPLKQYPVEWSPGPIYANLFAKVREHQWTFFPFNFSNDQLDDHCLDNGIVLPIEKLRQISQGDAAVVHQIKIHDSCNFLDSKDQKGLNQDIFVLKTYHRPSFEKLYLNEVKALRMLKNSPSSNIVTYYGSFQQNDTYNIILEYADREDLGALFKAPRPEGSEVEKFWKSLILPCLEGLERVHHLMMNVDDQEVNGIHEDIKPNNILLFKGRSGSRYDFVPKIADFGLFTHVRKSNANSSEAMGLDNLGNQLYSAPECSHTSSYRENAPNMINTKADIFSFGAVLSDACAWIKGGPDEKTKYYEQRKKRHQSVQAFRGSDYEACFHDGVGRLDVVDEMHRDIRDYCQSVGDNITPRVMDIIEQHMMLPSANNRHSAKQLTSVFNEIFDIPDDQRKRPACDKLPTDISQTENERGLCLAALGDHIQRLQYICSYGTRKPRESIDTEIQGLLKDLEANVPDRHHILFFDDSTTMGKHAQSVEKASLPILHLARRLEGNDVEISFASKPRRLHRRWRVKSLVDIIVHHSYRREPGLIESGFGRLVDDVIVPRLPIPILGLKLRLKYRPFTKKPTSIYVFTDGDWGKDLDIDYRVERPIERLNDLLKERKLDKNHVSFHFIRLGDSENGKAYLNHLDSLGWDDNWDNVDVKSITSSVKDIFIGPLVQ
ncbi:hypothetical protein F5Y11DRAFT_359799 [Daldinia sp. FL1419]|nr:hypothetical protein F5Y11DRAFT_359799 [Daldinia sp. FL1419]